MEVSVQRRCRACGRERAYDAGVDDDGMFTGGWPADCPGCGAIPTNDVAIEELTQVGLYLRDA